MPVRKIFRVLFSLGMLCCPLLASAMLTVTFNTYVASAVPLHPWVSVLAGLAIAVLALLMFRSRRWREHLMVVVGVAVALAGLTFKKNASANILHPYTVSSDVFSDSGFGPDVTDVLSNGTGHAIVITGITDSAGPNTRDPSSTCQVGTVLPPSGSCTVVHN